MPRRANLFSNRNAYAVRHFERNKPKLLLFRFLLRNRSACAERNLSSIDAPPPKTSVNQEKRKELCSEAQKLFAEDLPYISL